MPQLYIALKFQSKMKRPGSLISEPNVDRFAINEFDFVIYITAAISYMRVSELNLGCTVQVLCSLWQSNLFRDREGFKMVRFHNNSANRL